MDLPKDAEDVNSRDEGAEDKKVKKEEKDEASEGGIDEARVQSATSLRISHVHSLEITSEIRVDNDDLTCCHRATWCHPSLSEILVTDPIFKNCCPQFTYDNLFWIVTVIAMLMMAYIILYFYVGDSMLPGGNIFGLFVVIVFAYILGWSLAYLPYLNLPPFFGMLLAGIIVRNAEWYNIKEELGSSVKSKIRTFSMTFVMLRAGLQLTSTALWEHPMFLLFLAIVPCTMDLLTVSLCCRCILGYPWSYAFLTG